jgi:acyl transferase domain-containing protein
VHAVSQLTLRGTDAAIEIPLARWDNDAYFDPEAGAQGKYYVNHAAFIEGIHIFDNRCFGITPYEAMGMDP